MTDQEANATLGTDDVEAAERLTRAAGEIREELRKGIVGQELVIDQLLTCIFAQGHSLLVGVPGLAKTLMVRYLARTLSLTNNRIQFTPDLMPSDITGTEVIQEDKTTGERTFKFLKGPIFANFILADEINRTPPKTQAALLEAMQEFQVTAGGKKFPLEPPFFVLATQNPIEQEGTYPLPEAQLDRFMMNVVVDYPTEMEELEVMKLTTTEHKPDISAVLTREDLLALQDLVRRVPVAESIVRYAMRLVRATRVKTEDALPFVDEWVAWGAGPRACQYLILGGKARAVLQGRTHVGTEDIKAVAHPVLRHRVITNYNAEAAGITSDTVIDKLLEEIPATQSEATADERLPKVFGS